jgi:dihydrofolate synthase/folylpolyglutamate synthase
MGGEPIGDDALAPLLSEVLFAAPDLSFFETATLAAFVAFGRANVDVAVVEVGLGGRLDATNVVPAPRAAAITRIAFDHMDRLGPTLVDIAREKAGIAKPGVELVLGPIGGEPLRAIQTEAARRGATTKRAERHPVSVGLAGPHQLENAAVAWALAEKMGAPPRATEEGLLSARWPGRLERIERDGPWLLDAAHNPDGASALVRALDGPARVIVFGALADKSWPEMLTTLAPLAPSFVYVAPPVLPGVPRTATDPRAFAELHAGETAANVPRALARAREIAGPQGLVVVCGSIFLVGAARAYLLGLPSDPPVAL